MPEAQGADVSNFAKLLNSARGWAERLKPSVQVQIIDENHPGNILSDKGRLPNLTTGVFSVSPYSTERFSEQPGRQTELAKFLGDNFYAGGAVLDVGFGGNQFILDYFSSKGVKTDGIDAQQGPRKMGNLFVPPEVYEVKANGVNLASGDISQINDPASQLKNHRYGLVIFNGSWHAAGNNWTVGGEMLEAKYHQQGEQKDSSDEFVDKEKQRVLSICKGKLMGGGKIVFVSSRYAFHGAGYNFQNLPYEKLENFWLADKLYRMGAKKIAAVGISQDGFSEMVQKAISEGGLNQETTRYSRPMINDEIQRVITSLKDPQVLMNIPNDYPIEDKRAIFLKQQRSKVLGNKSLVSELNKLARIDTLVGFFG